MTNKDLRKYICEIIDFSFERLTMIYQNNIEDKTCNVSRLVFPHYWENKTTRGDIRVSEQELRFVFVEVFNQYCDLKGLNLFYSVETPTCDKYKFGDVPHQDNNGQSAMFDLVIFDESLKRRALIEFKARNADRKSHTKDLVKLTNPAEQEVKNQDDVLRFFIEILENYNSITEESLNGKLQNPNKFPNPAEVEIRVESLNKGEKKLEIINKL